MVPAGRAPYDPAVGVDRKQRWMARAVTYGLVLVLGFGVVQQIEAWPITSYRLFSQVRTDRSTSLELVAVGADGTRTLVRPSGEVAATTAHQYRELRLLDPDRQQTQVHAWLDSADVDAEGQAAVRLERVTRRLDPDGGPATELTRVLVVEVPL